MKIHCIVIEDEPLAMSRISEYIQKTPFLNLLQCFDNGMESIEFLDSNKVDLIFLDIHMDGFSGIQLLETISNKPEIILTTAYDKYALKGYELNVSDYLLKPYTFERFIQAVQKVHKKLNSQSIQEIPPYIFVKTEYRLEKIFTDTILFIEGQRDYRQIHTTQKKIMTLETFTDLEQKLPQIAFCRVHKSYLVGVRHIELVERDRIKINKDMIPISETYKENFYKLISKS